MVHEPKLKPLMLHDKPLDELGRDLIAAANAAGGRDNITVVLFRLEEVEAQAGAPAAGSDGAALEDEDTAQYDTFSGEAVTTPRQGVSRPPEARTRGRDEGLHSRASDAAEAEYRASGTVALSAVRPRARPIEEPHAHAPPGRPPARRRRRIVTPAQDPRRGRHHGRPDRTLGSHPPDLLPRRRRVPRERRRRLPGAPYDLPLGVKLYSIDERSGVTLQSVPAARRTTFTDHQLRSQKDAENLLLQLEQGQISR